MFGDLSFWLPRFSIAWPLLLSRTLGVAATAPGWGMGEVGWRIRLGLAMLLALVIAPMIGPELEQELAASAMGGHASPAAILNGGGQVEIWAAFVVMLVVEAAIGAALGMGASLVISAARQAGEVIGLQAGLAPASLLMAESGDPSGGGLTPLGHLYGLVALATFLAVDGPLRLVEVLAESYRTLPVGLVGLGGSGPTADLAASAFRFVGGALTLAVRAAAPVATALILAGLALGWLIRSAPGLAPSLSGLVWPARSAIGLTLAWVGLAGLVAVLATAW